MGEISDIETIYRQEKERWFQEVAPRNPLRDLLTERTLLDCPGRAGVARVIRAVHGSRLEQADARLGMDRTDWR